VHITNQFVVPDHLAQIDWAFCIGYWWHWIIDVSIYLLYFLQSETGLESWWEQMRA